MEEIVENNGKILNLKREMSLNFRIKVYSTFDSGKSLNSLRGYSGLINLIGDKLAVRFMINAIMSDQQKVVNQLRRGIRITFYSK